MEQRCARPRKPARREAVYDGSGCGFDGGLVNKFPVLHQILAQPLRGFPRLRRTRKPAVPAGHGIARKSVGLWGVAIVSRSRADMCPCACAMLAERANCANFFRAVPCPAKRVSVSAGSGGDAQHRKGMGWRCPCLHGTAQSLARKAAKAARRNSGFCGCAQRTIIQRNVTSHV